MKIIKQINQLEKHIVLVVKRISILNSGKFVKAVEEQFVVVALVFVVGGNKSMILEKYNPTSKIKIYIRKKAIKNVEERITYQQKKISAYTVQELRKLILSEEKKILQGAGWKGAVVAVGAMFGITNF